MSEKKEYRNDGVLMGNINSPMVTFRCGITLDQAKDLSKYANDNGWINFEVMHTKNGKSIMKVLDPRLVEQNKNEVPEGTPQKAFSAPDSSDDLPF
jgi:hypothetical protein